MQNAWKIDRRTLLRGVGAGVALPLLDIMRGSASASESAAPVRMVAVFQPNGVYPKAWDVQGRGRDFELSEITQPFAPVKEKLNVISHLDNVGTKGHVQMTGSFLTGVAIQNRRNGVSLDQMIAQRIGQDTALKSLELGTEPPRQGNAGAPISFANTVSWSSPTTRLNPEINPRVAFDRMFRQQVSPEARRRTADHQSVVDLVMEDANSLRRKASVADQQKLDEYLESVRSVERQLDRALNPPPRSWTPPTAPELQRPQAGIPRERDVHLRLMMDLLVMALWTDTTRVATLMTAHGFSRQNFSFLEGVKSDHHGMSHHKNQASAVAEYTTVSRWYAEQVSYLLQRMDAVDEGRGSMLDNSVVMYGSGMKDGNGHVRENLPIVVAGGAGGKMRTGQHLVCKPHTPLANLHLTLAQIMGMEMDSFNGASTGVVDGLQT